MTKSLTKSQKAANKKVKQQKKKSETVKTITQPKPEDPPVGAEPVNLCDGCAYEFGSCEGVPKFASDFKEGLTGAEADHVVECKGFLTVDKMPTAEELAAAETDSHAREIYERHSDMGEEELIREYGPVLAEKVLKLKSADQPPPGEPPQGDDGLDDTEPEEEVPVPAGAPLPGRPDPKRFQEDDTDYGNCPSCETPLKRTAYNRYRDAIRCTNPRCRAYRAIVKDISTRVK